MDSSKVTIFLGPPGTAKTTTLLNIVEGAISSGISPRKIMFVAFTKKAAEEGKSRARERFNLEDEDLPWFRTLHSLAFRVLGVRRDQIVSWKHLKELGKKLGVEFKGKKVDDGEVYGMNDADRLLFLEGLARAKDCHLKKVWEEADDENIDWWELERFKRAYELFKRSRMLIDYNDLLENFCSSPIFPPQMSLTLVDEAQDLSKLQWRCVDKLSEGTKRVYVGGDDEQCIFGWSGADVESFINLEGEVKILDQSYRVPKSVHDIALSIASNIQNRRKKEWRSRAEQGSVDWLMGFEEAPLESGEWLLLARNGYMLDALEEHCIRNGFSFHSVGHSPLDSPALEAIKHWENLRRGKTIGASDMKTVSDFLPSSSFPSSSKKRLSDLGSSHVLSMQDLKEHFSLSTEEIWHTALSKISSEERDYFIEARKKGEPLLNKPRIRISTIHSSKGGEADNVLLMTDVSYRCFQKMSNDLDDEARVFYVAVTRARKSLFLVSPQTDLFFSI